MKRYIFVTAVLGAALATAAVAGECTRSEQFYIESLESGSCAVPWRCLSCVGIPHKAHARWGLKSERQHLFALRGSPYRERMISAAEGLLGDPAARNVAALVLAFQGVPSAGDTDVFVQLTDHENYPYFHLRWYALASLQDARALEFGEAEYRRIRAENEELTPGGRDALMEIIDCLFHFQSQGSRTVLQRLAKDESDLVMRRYFKSAAGV